MPRKASPLKNWEVVTDMPKRRARSKSREESAELFNAFISAGEKMMATTLSEGEMKKQLAKLRSALKAMPEYGEKIKVGKSGDKMYMRRLDLEESAE